jgi:chromosome partitioning protein
MVIVFGGIKGGTGKSTLAVNMAVWLSKIKKRQVMVLDGDLQLTTTHFTEFRGNSMATGYGSAVVQESKLSLTQLLAVLTKPGVAYDDVVLDVGGRDTTIQREAMTLADILVVPLALSGFDVWPLQELLDLVTQARKFNPKLQVFLVANRCDYRGANTAAYREVAQLLAGMDLGFRGLVTNRVVYSRSTAQGLSVFDDHLPAGLPDEKAQAELTKLFEDILAATTHANAK